MVEKVATDVITLLRHQEQRLGDATLLSIKVAIPEWCDADEVARYISSNINYTQYKVHPKPEAGKNVLAIGFRR